MRMMLAARTWRIAALSGGDEDMKGHHWKVATAKTASQVNEMTKEG